jgi:cell division protein ZapA (FtsZ GTPase activity inhibitor)
MSEGQSMPDMRTAVQHITVDGRRYQLHTGSEPVPEVQHISQAVQYVSEAVQHLQQVKPPL